MATERVRGCGRASRAAIAAAMLAAAIVPVVGPVAPARGDAVTVPGTGAPRPRVQYDPGSEADLRSKLTRDPYARVFRDLHGRTSSYLTATIGDPAIVAQRNLSRAAKNLALEYALDRTVINDTIGPFASPSDRTAVGDQVRALLLALYDRSRMAVPAPLGGFDRDINTSEEIINYATAFDTMLGAGFDFGADHILIVQRLAAVTNELYTNYVHPETANNSALLNQNNHRTKSGSAAALAAVVLADDVDPDLALAWWDWGVAEVDDILRFIMSPGDGGYAEGPWYYRYSMQNVVPFLAVWERLLGAASWTTADGIVVPAYQHHPLFAAAQRWMIDTLAPDGTMTPIDDTNPGRSYYFGALPNSLPTDMLAAAADRWPNTPQPYETDGSVDLAADSIVAFDDSIDAAPPSWSPTQVYEESGVAALRGGWDADALAVFVLGEHGTASEFGRDRLGMGRAPQSHEHPDPASFMLYAGGQRLVLDPGYLTFTTHGLVNQPQDHNVVLVDGKGPVDPLVASLQWLADPTGPPPTDGQSTLFDALDTDGVDSVSVVSRYGTSPITIRRDVATIDDRFVVIIDDVATADGAPHDLAWQLHGNGGGTSGGDFESTPIGGRWTTGGNRLDAAYAATDSALTRTTRTDDHEVPYGALSSHTALETTAQSSATAMLQVLVPTAAADAAPTITDRSTAGQASIEVVAGTTRLDAYARRDGQAIIDAANGVRTDGRSLTVVHDRRGWSTIHARDATFVEVDGVRLAEQATHGTLTWHHINESIEFVADGASPRIAARTAPFTFTVDHACSWTSDATWIRPVMLAGSPRVVLGPSFDAIPALGATHERRATIGKVVTVRPHACDAEGGMLTWRWDLVSAPSGSAWSLIDATSAEPKLLIDRAGPYRLRGVVTDAVGQASDPIELLVIGGARDADGIDNDLDGLFDTQDPDLDGADPLDAAIVVSPGGAVAGATAPRSAVRVTWQPGAGTSSMADRIRSVVSFGSDHALVTDLRRNGATWTGSLLYVDATSPTPITVVSGDELIVVRLADRVWLLQSDAIAAVVVDGQTSATL
jgi:hypothetical protein